MDCRGGNSQPSFNAAHQTAGDLFGRATRRIDQNDETIQAAVRVFNITGAGADAVQGAGFIKLAAVFAHQGVVGREGILAARGDVSIAPVLLLAFLAGVLGNTLGYVLGRWGGRLLLSKVGISETRMRKMERLFSRYGGGVVLFGRFFDGLRQFSGIMAGSLQMPWWKFTVFNVLGAIAWTALWGLGVYFLDQDIKTHLSGRVPLDCSDGGVGSRGRRLSHGKIQICPRGRRPVNGSPACLLCHGRLCDEVVEAVIHTAPVCTGHSEVPLNNHGWAQTEKQKEVPMLTRQRVNRGGKLIPASRPTLITRIPGTVTVSETRS